MADTRDDEPADPRDSSADADGLVNDLRRQLTLVGSGEDATELRALLGMSLLHRYRLAGMSGDQSDVDEAISSLSEARSQAPEHPDVRDWTAMLGAAHAVRHHLKLVSGDLGRASADRDAAIRLLRAGLDGRPSDDPELLGFRASLGALCCARAHEAAGPAAETGADVHTAIEQLEIVVGLPGLGPVEHAEAQGLLGMAFGLRRERTGDLADLHRGIARLEAVEVFSEPAAIPGRAHYALALGKLLVLRGMLTGTAGDQDTADDQDAAVRHLRTAVAGLPPDDPQRPQALVLLSCVLFQRGVDLARQEWLGTDEDLATIVGHATEALPALPESEPSRATLTMMLAFARFQRIMQGTAEPGDLESAVADFAEAVEVLDDVTEILAAEHREALQAACSSLVWLCTDHGVGPGTANLAVELLGRVRSRRSRSDPAWHQAAAQLGMALVVAYELGQRPEGLTEAAGMLQEALACAIPGHPATNFVRAALGAVLARRAADVGGKPDDVDRGIEALRRGLEGLPADHRQRRSLTLSLATALLHRFALRQQIEDLDAARANAQQVLDAAAEGSPHWAAALPIHASARFYHATAHQDRRQADEAVQDLRTCLDAANRGSPMWSRMAYTLGSALTVRGQTWDSPADREEANRLLAAASGAIRPDDRLHQAIMVGAAAARVLRGPDLPPRVQDLDILIDHLQATVGAATSPSVQHVRELASLGGFLFLRHVVKNGGAVHRVGLVDRDRAWPVRLEDLDHGRLDLGLDDLDEAIRTLEAALALIEDPAATPWWTAFAPTLAMALRRRSRFIPADRRRSRKVALDGLRGFTRYALLQAGTEDAMAAARDAAEDALTLATWCMDDGALEDAVEALESGRGLVLHAATTSATVADELRAVGHTRLAEEWASALAATRDREAPSVTGLLGQPGGLAAIPDDLSFRVLTALGATGQGASAGGTSPRGHRARLLVPPSLDDIRAALASLDADALVYLVPRSENARTEFAREATGAALIVPVAGAPVQLPLPRLTADPGSPLAAYVDVLGVNDPEPAGTAERWADALEEICEWAWSAAAGPLLAHIATWRLGRPARLVLIPVGTLGLVPWHAARTTTAGGLPRFAIQDAVFSYAASARLLCETARRPPLPRNGQALLVGDPTDDLPYAILETVILRAAYYPDSIYMGRPADVARGATGTAEELLRHLPGSERSPAVQHLACHAVIEDAPARSFLKLAGDQQLTVGDLLLNARGRRPDAPGATVILAACTTNLAGRQHDEALTLATGFLAAGAATAVGSLWRVPDEDTALLMFMFHHYLNEHSLTCRDALRKAQLWMLDPNRTTPLTMPPTLAGLVETTDPAQPHGWAAFTHLGR